MFYVYLALGIVVVLGLVVQVGGMLLPIKHRASLSRLLAAKPERVWTALTEIESLPKWRAELISVEKKSDDPLSWNEKSKFGDMPIRVEVFEPPSHMVSRIDSKGLPFGGTWSYDLAPEGDGTRLTITEDGEVYPPAFRFLSKFVFGHTKTIDGVLSQLDAYLKKEVH